MKIELFKLTSLVKVQDEDGYSLFLLEEDADCHKLVPVDFAQKQTFITVREDCNLIVLPKSVYTMDGEKVCNHRSDVEINKIGERYLIFADNELILWDTMVVLRTKCLKYLYSDKYFLTFDGRIWSAYKACGTQIEGFACTDNYVYLKGNFVVACGLGRRDLYTLRQKGKLLKKQSQKVVCSEKCQFALCSNILGHTEVLFHGGWHDFGRTEDFGIVSEKQKLFYVRRNGKCFLYDFNLRPELDEVYPDGFDVVAATNENMIAVINGTSFEMFYR